MRRLAELPPARAVRLTDALIARGLAARVREGEGRADGEPTAEVWVVEEDDLPPAREELAAFLANPDAPRYAAAAKEAARRRDAAIKERAAAAKRFRRGREAFRDAASGMSFWKRAPVCTALIAACAVAALFGWDPDAADWWILWAKPEPLLKWLYLTPVFEVGGEWRWDRGAGLAATLRTGQLWRLVTPIFIHRDPLHLLFNLTWLVSLGAAVERRFGAWRTLAFVLAAAAASNVAEFYMDLEWGSPVLGLFRFGPGNPMGGGMSGVVYALFGLVWVRSRGGDAAFFLPPNTVLLMVGWLLLCVTGQLGPIGNVAHAGGLLFGAAVGWLSLRLGRRVMGKGA